MGRTTAVLTVAGIALGCGRVSFDTRSDAGDDGRTDDVGPDAPPVPFCESRPTATFCSDFSSGSAGWAFDETQNGSYVIEPTGGPTPLSGALVVTTNVGGGPAEVNLLIGYAAPTASLTYSFDVKIDVAGVGYPALGLAVFSGVSTGHGVEYVYDPVDGTASLEEIVDPLVGMTTFTNTAVPSFPPNEWHRVSVSIATGVSWSATVEIDGALPTDVALGDTTNGSGSLSVGAPYLGDTTLPWVIRISNVLLDVQ